MTGNQLYPTTIINNVGIGKVPASNVALDVSGNLHTTADANINGVPFGIGTGTGSYNIAIGYLSLQANTIGTNNFAFGVTSLEFNTTGSSNAGFGNNTLKNNTTGSSNNAFGVNSLTNNTTGSDNTGVGNNSLSGITGSSSGNIGIGNNSGDNITTGTNNTCIGYNSQASAATVNNEFTLGNGVAVLRCAVTTITTTSDVRDKKEIKSLENGLQFVEKLNPVSFIWNMRDKGKVDIPEMGFIAQDLQQVQKDTGITIPNLVYESNPDRLEASYGTLLPILVKAVQELSAEVKALKNPI